MNKSIKKNYTYNLIYQLIVIILPIITTPYLSRVLGAENIGIYGYTISIVTYFILFGTLGISMYGQREIAYKAQNKKEQSKTFFEIIILRAFTLTISIITFYMGISKWKFNSLFGMGSQEHNRKLRFERESQRPVNETEDIKLWGIWNSYK